MRKEISSILLTRTTVGQMARYDVDQEKVESTIYELLNEAGYTQK